MLEMVGTFSGYVTHVPVLRFSSLPFSLQILGRSRFILLVP